MKKYFIPYELAKQLIELGFDEKTFDVYNDGRFKMDSRHNIPHTKKIIWEQAFSWFREKYGCEFHIECRRHTSVKYYEVFLFDGNKSVTVFGKSLTYKEAELECLKKLIEIVKIKQHE